MEKDWVKIYSNADVINAEIVKSALIENGLQAVIINKKASSFNIGEAELYVKQEEALKAAHIIKNVFDA